MLRTTIVAANRDRSLLSVLHVPPLAAAAAAVVRSGERGTTVDIRPTDSAPTLAKGLLPAAPPAATQTGEIMVPPGPSSSDSMATKDQLVQAQEYLGTLRSDRAESCRELEEEAKVFLDSPSTPEQERRFRLIYQLLRYQVRPLIANFKRSRLFFRRSCDDLRIHGYHYVVRTCLVE